MAEDDQTFGSDSAQITPDQLDAHLGGALAGHGSDYISAGQQYGVDPRLLAAISMFETGNGTSRIVRQLNNVGGITGRGYSGVGGNYQPFNTIGDSIMRQAQMVARAQQQHGLKTLEQLAWHPVYGWAPLNAKNDPNDTNRTWPASVRAAYNKLGGRAYSGFLKQGQGANLIDDVGEPAAGQSFSHGATFGPESGGSEVPSGYDVLSKDWMQGQIHNNFPEYNDSDPEQVWQAFDKKNDTPLKKIQALFPEYADREPHLLAEQLRQKYYPNVTSDEFWERLNPPTGLFAGVQAELGNLSKGFMAQGSATLHASSAKAYEEVGAGQEFGKWIADQIGATPYIQGIQQFLGHPEGYFRQAVKYLDEQGKRQEEASAQSAREAEQAKGVGGYVGRVGGAIAGGIPELASTAAIPGGSLATRIALASGYEALSGFGQKIQESQENAFTQAAQDGFMGATNALVINSPLGRLKSGLTFSLINTGQTELQNWINGKPSSVQDDALHASVDFGLGFLMGKARERAPVAKESVAQEALVPQLKSPHMLYGDPDEPGWQGGVPAPVMEELNHAIEARDQGDYNTAAEHIDRAMAMMSPKDQADVTQRVVDHINPKPEEKKPLSDDAVKTFVNHFYGLGDRGQMGSAINPFHRRPKEEKKPTLLHERAPEDYTKNAIIARQGGFDIARPDSMKPEYIVLLNGEEMQRFPTMAEAQQAIQTFRSKYPGQAGFSLDPGQILHEFFRDTFPKIKEPFQRFGQSWRETFEGEKVEPRMAAISKYRTSEGQMARRSIPGDIARQTSLPSWFDIRSPIEKVLHIDQQLRGITKVSRRKAFFNEFTRAQLKEMMMNHEEGRTTGNRTADEILKFHDEVYKAMYGAEAQSRFSYDARDWYIFHGLKNKEDQAKFASWFNKISSVDPRFTHKRQLPTWRQVFAQGFEPSSYNPEDLMQMRLGQSTNAIRKVLSLDDATKAGLAIRSKEATQDIKESWGDPERSPNGEMFYVEPNAHKVLELAWDQSNIANAGPVVGPLYRGFMIGKGVTAGLKMGWSVVHIKHIAKMGLSSQMVRLQKMAMSGERRAQAWQDGLKQFFKLGITNVREVDAWQGKLPISDLSVEERTNIEHTKMMGLDLSTSDEREMQFANQVANWMPQWEKQSKTVDKLLKLGYQIGTAEPLMHYMFGTVIPRLKFGGAMAARDNLLREHPELTKPENRLKLQAALSGIGREIEARFGEMNYDNLLWKNAYKQIGKSSLLSLGWQLSAIRIYGGAIKDLTLNIAHSTDLVKKLQGQKVDHNFLTDRLLFAFNYTALNALEGAIITYIATKTIPQGLDYVYPRVGKNPDGTDKRVSPVEFSRELFSLLGHLKTEGGGWGSVAFIRNKLQPFLSTFLQDFENKDFYGVKISDGDPFTQLLQGNVMGSGKSFVDRLAYMLQSITPITFGTVTQNTGQPKDSWDVIRSFAGLPPAPRWTTRTDIENDILAELSREFPHTRTKQDETRGAAIGAYKEALRSKDPKAIEEARQSALKAGVTEKSLEFSYKNLDKTSAMTNLKRLSPEAEVEIYGRMSDEEKKKYFPYLRKSVQQLVSGKN